MTRTLILCAGLLLPLAAAAQSGTPAPAPAPAETQHARYRVFLIGDSTVARSSGWGGSFCAAHVKPEAACVNLARGGRSSGSFRAEGLWDAALEQVRKGGAARTWVLIQFGHNDQPGKPGRSTDLAIEFPANLARYVDEVRAAGAVPVLVTPLTRRSFTDGRLQNDLAPWAEAVRRVAAQKKVALVDLNARSAAAVQAMGEEAADRFAQAPKPAAPAAPKPPQATEVVVNPAARPKLAFDRTHLGREGADYFARMMAGELARAVPGMRRVLIR
ncbi:rhamnogalacturonan acetylesterase [Sphingomonas sp.]|uniref:rhamnogalacturonan acetylesterase n=1 Tax=Sphingomonas sp. TaxID=28214 RepID=UPI002EDA2D37